MDNLSLFVDSLQGLMAERNIKPDDIRAATKISLPVIYNWLRKSAMPTLQSLIILSGYFQCSLEYLTGRADKNYFVLPNNFKTFPERLRLLLNKNKVSIRKLAKETQIAKSAVSYFLNGSVEPLLDNLIKLANYFDCTLDYLIGREN